MAQRTPWRPSPAGLDKLAPWFMLSERQRRQALLVLSIVLVVIAWRAWSVRRQQPEPVEWSEVTGPAADLR